MAASSYFAANDSDLNFNLHKRFHDHVALYTKLHFPENKSAVSNSERRELSLKLQESVNDMSQIALKIKQFKSDTKIVKYP